MTTIGTSVLGSTGIDLARLDTLRASITAQRDKLLGHPIYGAVVTLPRLRQFMSHHVFAVWDFMCLAKRLQRDLTSLGTIWLPPDRPSLARFINSVVLGEESDVDPDRRAASHFGLYLGAMEEAGAPTVPVRTFIEMLRGGAGVRTALSAVGATPSTSAFVLNTMDTVEHGTTIEVLSSFLFGREDLIPEMFLRFLPQWEGSREARWFTYYIERHIELDGDEHGPAGQRAIAELAGDDERAWESAARAAAAAIDARLALWDGIHGELIEQFGA
jgi:hypothetical protein